MKYKFLIVLLLGLFVGFIIGNRATKTNNLSQSTEQTEVEEKTEIIEYQQKYIPTKSEKGYCWTTSIATPYNEKAWRCSVGNFIHDPCFETEDGKIVCDVDPELISSGFELKLTESLPQRGEPFFKVDHPWLIKFASGLICYTMTGSAGDIGEESFHYSCDKEAVILGEINTENPIWSARVGYLTKDYKSLIKEEKLKVLKAWY